MSNNQGWEAPSAPPVDGGATPWMTPGASSAPGPQPIPAWQQQQQSTPGWTPPPKPGLIPLRPLSFGTIIGSSFSVMRRNPAPTFGLSVLLYGFITIVYTALIGALFALTFGRIAGANVEDQPDIMAGSMGLIALSMLVPVALSIVGAGFLQGIITLEVSRATLGEKLRIRGLWRLARGRLWALVGWAGMLTAFIIVYLLVSTIATVAVFALLAAGAGTDFGAAMAAAVIGMLVSAVIGLAFLALGAWLGIKLSLAPSIIMLERLSLGASLARSWSLTRGHFWRTLGTQLLIGVIVYAAAYFISIPISIIGSLVMGLANPNSDPVAAGVAMIILLLVLGIVTAVVGAIGIVMQSASLALIYIDIRMRKEGLDLELLRYTEAKQAGTGGVENPYLRLQYAPGAAPAAVPNPGSPWA